MKIDQLHIPLNILLAEDDLDDRFFFDKALKEINIATHLTTVSDGDKLMNYLSECTEHLPDVLFLDLSMPRKNGIECLAEIKEDNRLKDLQVIMFSTSFTENMNFEQGLINSILKMGALDFIRKPTDFSKLKQLIQNALILLKEKESA
jgi:CheY-like chemotaxis protein